MTIPDPWQTDPDVRPPAAPTRPTVCLIGPDPDDCPQAARTMNKLGCLARRGGWRVITIHMRLGGAHASSLTPIASASEAAYRLSIPAERGDQPEAVFGDATAETLLVGLLTEYDVTVLHAHWAGPATAPTMVQRAWYLGIPALVTVHDSWGTESGPSPDALLDAHLRECAAMADAITADGAGTATALEGAPWRGQFAPVVSTSGADASARWCTLYSTMSGDIRPPVDGPMLSVVVTAYDRPDALGRCLRSLARQTLPRDRYEVVVVDDCSPSDVTPALATVDGLIDLRYLRHPENRGLGEARNTGVDAARGEIVMLMDDDDEATPRCLAEHVRAHQANPDPAVAVLGFTGLAPHITVDAVTRHVLTVGQQYFAYPGISDGAWLDWRGFWGGRSSAKRSLLAQVRFEARFLEDADFAYRARDRGFRVLYARHAVQHVGDSLDHDAFRRRQTRMGQARAEFARNNPELAGQWYDPSAPRRELNRLGARRTAPVTGLRPESLLNRSLPWLRAHVCSTADGRRRALDLLDDVLAAEYAGHQAAGMLVPALHDVLAARPTPLRVRVAGDHPQLAEIVVEFVRAPAAVHAVLVVTSLPSRAAATLTMLGDALTAAGIDAQDGPEIEIVPTLREEDVAADVQVPPVGGWPAAAPLPLLGEPLTSWLVRLTGDRVLSGSLR